MSIVNGAVVYRVAGNREIGGVMVDTLIAQDNKRLRSLLLDTTNTLRVYRAVRLSDDERRLAKIAERVNAPVSLWYRVRRFCAFCLLLPGAILSEISGK